MKAFPIFRFTAIAAILLLARWPVGGWAYAEAETITVATFNIEWLGYPANSRTWSGSRSAQIDTAANEIMALDADIVALQEIIIDPVNGDALADLLDRLNQLDGTHTWDGRYNEKFSIWWNPNFHNYPAQRQAFIWREGPVRLVAHGTLLEWIPAYDSRFGSGRLPHHLEVMVGAGDIRRPLHLINLHLKCCRGHDDRRLTSMVTLIGELRASLADQPLVVLGDFNVADRGGAYGEIAEWGIYDDHDNNGAADFFHAAGSVEDRNWSDIDHILLSEELEAAYTAVPAGFREGIVNSVVSDHDAVFLRLTFVPTVAEHYNAWASHAFSIDPLGPPVTSLTAYADDPDGDGIANFAEFAMGGSPILPDPKPKTLRIEVRHPAQPIVAFSLHGSLPDSAFTLWTSTDLGGDSPWSAVSATFDREPAAQPAMDRISLPLDALPDSAQRFFQLQVHLP